MCIFFFEKATLRKEKKTLIQRVMEVFFHPGKHIYCVHSEVEMN